MFFFEKIEVPEIALLGVGRNFSCLSGARREVSYLFIWWCYLSPSLLRASLGADSTFTSGVALGRPGTVRGGALCREIHVKF